MEIASSRPDLGEKVAVTSRFLCLIVWDMMEGATAYVNCFRSKILVNIIEPQKSRTRPQLEADKFLILFVPIGPYSSMVFWT